MAAAFKPQDCTPPCKYPDRTLPTGSGHSRDCPAHLRWSRNGNTWRTPPGEADPWEKTKHTQEARERLDLLRDFLDSMTTKQRDFVTDMLDRFDHYGDRTWVSDSQAAWVERLAEEFLR